MPRVNAVLKHPQKQEIHDALIRNEPYRTVAKQYSMSPSSVFRYKQDFVEGLQEAVAAHPDVQEARDTAVQAVTSGFVSIGENIEDIKWAKNPLKEYAEENRDNPRGPEMVGNMAIKLLDSMMKYAELRQDHTSLRDLPEYCDQLAQILAVLESHPEVRAAVAEVINAQ